MDECITVTYTYHPTGHIQLETQFNFMSFEIETLHASRNAQASL